MLLAEAASVNPPITTFSIFFVLGDILVRGFWAAHSFRWSVLLDVPQLEKIQPIC